jgi:hypothetical protein
MELSLLLRKHLLKFGPGSRRWIMTRVLFRIEILASSKRPLQMHLLTILPVLVWSIWQFLGGSLAKELL